jgi:hypothetical protein
MKRIQFLALVPILMLSACISPGKVEVAQVATSGASLYCGKARLTEQADGMMCNWESSAKAACRSSNLSTLAKGAISSPPKDAGRCDTGDWLVQVTAK